MQNFEKNITFSKQYATLGWNELGFASWSSQLRKTVEKLFSQNAEAAVRRYSSK